MKTLLRKASALIVAVLFSSAANFVSAQSQFCGTDEVMADMMNIDPNVLRAQQELEAFTQEYVRTHKPEISERGGPLYIIPIVFHIIHDNGVENVSDATIFAAVNILNQDFRKLNSDTSLVAPSFKHLIADCEIEFRLAQKDPDGNCTDGINRVFSYRTYQGNDRSKVVIWDRKNYLNVWVVNRIASAGVAAYAYLPAGAAGLGYKVDGVIAWYQYVGPTERTLTHEIGHSFNLSHPWGGGTVGTACGNDGVDDTPETEGSQSCLANPKIDFTCDKDSLKKTYQFNNVTMTSGNMDPDPVYIVNPNSPDTVLLLTNFTASNNLSANSAEDSVFAFSAWDTGGVNGDNNFYSHTDTIDTGKYYEFKVQPNLGQGMTLSRIYFHVRRSLDGPRMFSVRSGETNYRANFAANIVPALPGQLSVKTDTMSQPMDVPYIFYFENDSNTALMKNLYVILSGASYTNTDDTITFRIYAWNAESSAGTFVVDSVALVGTFGTIENQDNYMDYTFCDNMFTWGQAARMHAALESPVSSRNNLHTAANHALTGIDNPVICAPEADFYTTRRMACVNPSGGTIQFFDNSTRGPSTSWLWIFPNGNPDTATVANPIVTFNTLWGQSVTLTVSNSAGSSTITRDNVAWIAPRWSDFSGLYYDDFEDAARFNIYHVDNRSGNASSWHRTTSAAASGNTSLMLNAHSPIVWSTNTTPMYIVDWGIGGFDKDAFITPAFDLSEINAGTGKLEFKLAGSTLGTSAADITETLVISYSINCGNTWSVFQTLSDSSLCTAGSWQVPFVPQPAHWRQKSFNLTALMLADYVRFKFEYTSGDLSNNIYIDDLNISGTVGIADHSPGPLADLSVYPNPAAGDISVSYRLFDTRNVKLEVFDALGNLVYDLVNQKQSAGNYSVTFTTSKISNGIYHIKLSGDNVTLKTEKVAIIK